MGSRRDVHVPHLWSRSHPPEPFRRGPQRAIPKVLDAGPRRDHRRLRVRNELALSDAVTLRRTFGLITGP